MMEIGEATAYLEKQLKSLGGPVKFTVHDPAKEADKDDPIFLVPGLKLVVAGRLHGNELRSFVLIHPDRSMDDIGRGYLDTVCEVISDTMTEALVGQTVPANN